jgi:hypothetical protein
LLEERSNVYPRSASAALSRRSALRPIEEEPTDVRDEIVIDGLRIGDPRGEPDVGRDHRDRVLRRDRQVLGVGEPADVVADDGPGRARGVEHGRPPRVARDGDVEARVHRLDRRDDAVQLLGLPHLGARTRLHAADVEEVGTVLDQVRGAPDERIQRERLARVVERVRGPVEDAHDQGARGEVGDDITEAEARHRGRAYVPPTRIFGAPP